MAGVAEPAQAAYDSRLPLKFFGEAGWTVTRPGFQGADESLQEPPVEWSSITGAVVGGVVKATQMPLTIECENGMIKGCHGNVAPTEDYRCLTIESGIRMCEANS